MGKTNSSITRQNRHLSSSNSSSSSSSSSLRRRRWRCGCPRGPRRPPGRKRGEKEKKKKQYLLYISTKRYKMQVVVCCASIWFAAGGGRVRLHQRYKNLQNKDFFLFCRSPPYIPMSRLRSSSLAPVASASSQSSPPKQHSPTYNTSKSPSPRAAPPTPPRALDNGKKAGTGFAKEQEQTLYKDLRRQKLAKILLFFERSNLNKFLASIIKNRGRMIIIPPQSEFIEPKSSRRLA